MKLGSLACCVESQSRGSDERSWQKVSFDFLCDHCIWVFRDTGFVLTVFHVPVNIDSPPYQCNSSEHEGRDSTKCARRECIGRQVERQDSSGMDRHHLFLIDATVSYHVRPGQPCLTSIPDIVGLWNYLCGS